MTFVALPSDFKRFGGVFVPEHRRSDPGQSIARLTARSTVMQAHGHPPGRCPASSGGRMQKVSFALKEDNVKTVLQLVSQTRESSQGVFATLDRSFPKQPDPYASTSILSALAKASAIKMLMQTLSWHEMKKHPLNQYHYNTAINACAKTSMWTQALHFVRKMSLIRTESDIVTVSAAISSCEKGRKWEKAIQMFSDMAESKQLSNAITFNAAISACEKCNEWQKA
eukprot:TRINITY_DN27328_c0_g2_i2.p1 TRINITY_DN27328_c0_g2~~TRINITY_DN27328_c0_g2_i2.p1  ORF type:complete len:226 (-),score=35.47 TRINITY_DN27328_c0_g2_i2:52-729(-)